MTAAKFGLPLLFILAAMAGAGHPDEKPGILSEEAIHDALAKELREILDNGKRFTLLPANIADVHVSPSHVPCFVMSRGDYYNRAKFDVVLKSVRTDPGNFRLIIDGRVVGWGNDNRITVVDNEGTKGAVVEGGNARPITIPRGVNVRRAHECGGRRIYETYTNIVTDDGTILVDFENNRTRRPIVIPDRNGIVILEESEHGGSTLTVIAEKETEKRTSGGPLKGVVRSSDGGWIAIDEKILPLERDREKPPPEETIASALKAVEEVSMKDLSTHLEELTRYDHRHLAGLARQMQYKRSTVSGYRETEMRLQSLLSTIDTMRPPEMPGREEQRNKIVQLLDGYREQGRKTVEELRKIMAADPAIAMGNAGDRIVQGFQYSGGLWFKDAEIVEQADTGGATVLLSFDDGDGSGVRKGFFSIGDDGRAVLLTPLPTASNIEFTRGNDGNLLIFLHGAGLARLSRGTFEWIDRSGRMKRMEHLIGCDNAGRIYFGPRSDREKGRRWIFRPGGTVDKAESVESFPVHGYPTTDGAGSVWFVGRQGPATEALNAATALPVTFAEGGDLIGVTESDPALYRYADGALHRYVRHSALADGRLIGGKGKNVIVVALSTDLALAIKDDVVYAAKGIHELVKQRFDLLMEIAPVAIATETSSPDWHRSSDFPQSGSSRPRPSLLRVGDLLWVCDGASIEAYRKGRALFVGKRLELQGAKMANPAILGPIGAKKQVLLACVPQQLNEYFWATAGDEGIALERTESPPSSQGNVSLGSPEAVFWPPLVDRERGRLYCYRGFHDHWEIVGPQGHCFRRDSGEPRLLMKDDRLLVYRETREYRGYRLVAGNAMTDIAPTYVKNLCFLREEKDGVLLFAGPEGLVRLTPDGKGGYAIGATVNYDFPGYVDGYLGETNGALILTAGENDGRFVVIVPKK